MKFAVFAFDQYYPGGGWGDFVGVRTTLEEARALAREQRTDCTEIVDLDSYEVVE